MTREELKALRLHRQHLTAPACGPDICRDLNGIQAQFLSNARHALAIRGCDGPNWNQDLVKSWTIRGTVHVFREADLPLYFHVDRRHSPRPCDTLEADSQLSRERKSYFADGILDALGQGEKTREELRQVCRRLGMTEGEEESVFNPWGGTLRALAEAGRIVHLVRQEKAFRLAPEFQPMEKEAAWTEILRRYFRHCGPASLHDASYFLRLSQTELRRRMQMLDLRETVVEGVSYFDSGEMDPAALVPECLFLAGFDPLLLSYEKRENPFLPPECLRGIFNLTGIVMPAVLLRGRVAARWKLERNTLKVLPLTALQAEALELLREAAWKLWPEVQLQMKKPGEKM